MRYLVEVMALAGESRKTRETVEVLQFERESFSVKEYKHVIASLFSWASTSSRYGRLRATVIAGGEHLFTVYAFTRKEGSSGLYIDVYVGHSIFSARHVRTMTLAD